MAGRLGLGQKLGIDLPGEQPGLIPTTEWKKATLGESWQKGETLVCGIGQGFVFGDPAAAGDHGGPTGQWWAGRHTLAGDAAGQGAGTHRRAGQCP